MRHSKFKLVLAVAAIGLAGVHSTNASIIFALAPTGLTTYSPLPSGTGYSVTLTGGDGGGFTSGGKIYGDGSAEAVTATFTSPKTSVGFDTSFFGADNITSVSFSNGDTFSTLETVPSGTSSFDYTDTTPFTSATFNFANGDRSSLLT